MAQIFVVISEPLCSGGLVTSKILWVVLWLGCGRQGEVVFDLVETTEFKDKAFWFLLGWGILGSSLTNVWERTSFARFKNCASTCCKSLCSMSLFFRHIANYSMVHTPPCWVTGTCQLVKLQWCIGRGKFRAFCGGFLPCCHLEKPIVGNICYFCLPSIYSLCSGEHSSLPHS